MIAFNPACQLCRFFEQMCSDETGCGGECHRYPPTVVYDEAECGPVSEYPFISGTDWCGEFKPKVV